ncbi:MAG: hypothetical protein V1917_02855 [Candidatus Gottesmanbacteria bacterium]
MKIKSQKQTKHIFFIGIVVLLSTTVLFTLHLRRVFNTPYNPTSSTAPLKTNEVQTSTYDSQTAKLHFTFKNHMYVNEEITDKEGWKEGRIVISLFPGGNEEISHITIVYGIPEINGKGGACSPDGYQTKIILGQAANVCEGTNSLFAGYPKHPKEKIDYAIFIGGKNITIEAYQEYKEILYSGMRFIE